MKFWHMVRVIKSRILMILGLVAVTLVVVAVMAPSPTVVYPVEAGVAATQQVMGGIKGSTNSSSQPAAPDRNAILGNMKATAMSADVFEKAKDFLALDEDKQRELLAKDGAGKLPRQGVRRVTRIETSPGKPITWADWSDADPSARVLSVEPVLMAVGESSTVTDNLKITVTLRDGDVAPYLANAVVHAFIETFKEENSLDVSQTIESLDASVKGARARLDELNNKIAQYKGGHGVIDITPEQQQAISSLASLEAQEATARAAADEAAASLRDINVQLAAQPLVSRDKLPADMNPEVQKLSVELAQAEADLRAAAQRYKPTHDTYKALAARVAELKARIRQVGDSYAPATLNPIRQDLLKRRSEAQYNAAAARARLVAIQASLGAARAKAQSLSRAEPELGKLMLDKAEAEKRYQVLTASLNDAQAKLNDFTKTGSIIPYWASPTGREVVRGLSRKVLLIYGLILSLVVGIAGSVWLDSIDTRMRNAADVENLLALPVMGLTPQLTGRDGVLPKLTHIYPLSATAESYRILRTNILFALRDNPFKTLMVATGRPGQGGTTTICNLAIALAQIGKRIILIDADMRRPSLHKFFNVDNSTGLSTLLQGESKLTEVFRKTDVENLIVIPGGPQPLNPSELLGSERMREIVEMLEEHCDLVLFDTPSTVVFSDGPMLASWIDAVIMVVSANQTPRGTEVQTRDLLRKAKANILGVVVNRMAADLVDSCYYYSHYYADSAAHPPSQPLSGGNGSSSASVTGNNGRRAIAASTDPADKATADAGAPVEQQNDNPFPS